MKKLLFLLALSALTRKVMAAVKNNQPVGAEAKPKETLHPSTR